MKVLRGSKNPGSELSTTESTLDDSKDNTKTSLDEGSNITRSSDPGSPGSKDLYGQATSRKGLAGVFEALMRKFRVAMQAFLMTPVYLLGIFCLGVATTPSVVLYRWASQRFLQDQPEWIIALGTGVLLGAGFIIFGFTLLVVVPICNFMLQTYPKPWRGPYHSLPAIRWGIHNALTYLPRYIFLEYVTPSPFNILFYQWMGMKIGKDVQINTTNISDPSLIEIGDRVTVGGSATIIAHYGQGGFLVIAPVKIGKGVTIGLRATIMGGVEIGEKAKILPNSVVLPKTRIPAGETWGGVPAIKVDLTVRRERKAS